MRVAFDLDGTVYDTLPLLLRANARLRQNLGYPPITPDHYRRCFQTRDWHRLYRDLGFRDEHVSDGLQDLFYQEFDKEGMPELIPGAKKALCSAEEAVGCANLYIVTQEHLRRVRRRFSRDGLMHYLPNVDTPRQGKAREIHRLAGLAPHLPFVYIGDLVSDGESCLEAKAQGADNVTFYGIIHPPAMNPPDLMHAFVSSHQGFAHILENLDEAWRIWDQ